MWNGLSSGRLKVVERGLVWVLVSPGPCIGAAVACGVKAQRPQGESPRTNGLDVSEVAAAMLVGAGAAGVRGDASKRRGSEDRHSDVRGSSPASRSFAGWCPLLGAGQRWMLAP